MEECGGVWRSVEEDCGGVRRNEEEQWRHSLTYVIIIYNDVTRACSNTIRRKLLTTHFLASLHVYDTIVRAIYKRICCCLEFYKRSYSILLLLSTDFYNLAPRGVKYLILYEIVLVLYI